MENQKVEKQKQVSYTYVWVDGTRATLVAGQDGVTEEFIKLLHEMDREGANAERREKRKAPKYIEDIFSEDVPNDKNCLLCDSHYDPAEMMQVKADAEEHDRQLAKLQEALNTLHEKQKRTIEKLFFEGKSLIEVAVEEGVSGVAVINRRDAALVNLKKFLKK